MNKLIAISILLSLVLITFLACDSNQEQYNTDSEVSRKELEEGYTLINTYCISCHTPAGIKENRSAPPFIAIKKHYISEDTDFQTFKNDLVAFLNNPSKENSKLPLEVRKFGLMPKLSLNDNDLSKIAKYIYHTELESPKWLKKHYDRENEEASSSQNELSKLELGQQYAIQTKAVLGKNLNNAINTQGSDGAVQFCNIQAIHLTDSISKELHAKIQRLSDKPRNQNNLAQEPFLSKIEEYHTNLKSEKELKGDVLIYNNQSYFVYPILTNGMCLKCHGNKEDINPKTLEKIKNLYPADKAIGYNENELRGIWTVQFD